MIAPTHENYYQKSYRKAFDIVKGETDVKNKQ